MSGSQWTAYTHFNGRKYYHHPTQQIVTLSEPDATLDDATTQVRAERVKAGAPPMLGPNVDLLISLLPMEDLSNSEWRVEYSFVDWEKRVIEWLPLGPTGNVLVPSTFGSELILNLRNGR